MPEQNPSNGLSLDDLILLANHAVALSRMDEVRQHCFCALDLIQEHIKNKFSVNFKQVRAIYQLLSQIYPKNSNESTLFFYLGESIRQSNQDVDPDPIFKFLYRYAKENPKQKTHFLLLQYFNMILNTWDRDEFVHTPLKTYLAHRSHRHQLITETVDLDFYTQKQLMSYLKYEDSFSSEKTVLLAKSMERLFCSDANLVATYTALPPEETMSKEQSIRAKI